MKRSIVILLHSGFWLCYLLLNAMILMIAFKDNGNDPRIRYFVKTLIGFAIVPSAISFYSCYFLLFPKYLVHKKIFASIIYGLLIVAGSAVTGSIILHLMNGAAWDAGKENISYAGQVLFISFITLASGIVALVIKGFITWFEEIKLKEVLKQKTHEMELALVKSQLDPHFLFNTINNIDVLILKDALQASLYLNKLSDIMRFILYETKTDKILLSREIEYIERYVELQKIRTSNPTYANFSVTGIAERKTIAPMVFIPFIENAFKHTTNKKLENAITIAIQIKKEAIVFTCKNKYNPSVQLQQENSGLGNELIQKRLNLLYPNRHTLEIVNNGGLYSVVLTVSNE